MNHTIHLDSNIIIDYLRNRPEAIAFIEGLDEKPATSAIVVAELYAGIRDGTERHRLVELLNATTILGIDEPLAVAGGLIRRQYGKSHGVGLDDALIAATARAQGARLTTLNAKHFPMLKDVLVPYRKT